MMGSLIFQFLERFWSIKCQEKCYGKIAMEKMCKNFTFFFGVTVMEHSLKAMSGIVMKEIFYFAVNLNVTFFFTDLMTRSLLVFSLLKLCSP